MEIKQIELRDEMTCMAMLAIAISETDGWLARRAGYGTRCILFGKMDGGPWHYDPYAWSGSRTAREAHFWLGEHWDEIKSGDVLDVQYILGETKEPVKSDRHYYGETDEP